MINYGGADTDSKVNSVDKFIDEIPITIQRTKTLTKSKNGSNMGML